MQLEETNITPGRAALRDFNPVYVGSGSIVRITALQHWQPLKLSEQTLHERNRRALRRSIQEFARFRFPAGAVPSGVP
jgi:hypothetical protein